MKFSKAIYLQTHGLIQKKIEFNDIYILMDYLILNITNFHQKLKDRRRKCQVGQLIQ